MKIKLSLVVVVGVFSLLAYLRAPSTPSQVPNEPTRAVLPVPTADVLCRFQLMDDDGECIPHCKVAWCAPGLLMGGGLSDLKGLIEVRAPRGFEGAITFHLSGRTFRSLCPDKGVVGRLNVGSVLSGMTVQGVVDSATVGGGAACLWFHQATREGFATVGLSRGQFAVPANGAFRIPGILPEGTLVIGVVGSSREWRNTGIEWQPTCRGEVAVSEPSSCCFSLGRMGFEPPNLFGRVVNESGDPLSGVRVTYRPRGVYLSRWLAGEHQLPFGGSPPQGRSNAHGEFAFFASPLTDLGVVDLSRTNPDGGIDCWEGLKVVRTTDADDNQLVFREPLEDRP